MRKSVHLVGYSHVTVEILLFIKSQLKKMPKRILAEISARTVTSDARFSHPVERPGAVANVLTGIRNVLVKCLCIVDWK